MLMAVRQSVRAAWVKARRPRPFRVPRVFVVIALALGGFVCATPAVASGMDRVSRYVYADTRQLVAVVEEAAALMEHEGRQAFEAFAVAGSRWRQGERYLYVYTLEGTCVFHGSTPELVGRNLLTSRDIDGNPMVERIVDIGRRPEPDAAGWVFFLWENGTQISATFKSAYNRRVVMPDGQVLVVGSGLYLAKTEPVVAAERIDDAARYLEVIGLQQGGAALLARSSRFVFPDVTVFVLDEQGRAIVDPAFPTNPGRRLLEFTDAVGHQPIIDLMRKLKTQSSASVQFLARRPGAALPARKVIYARRVVVDGRSVIVGGEYFRPTPVWMRE